MGHKILVAAFLVLAVLKVGASDPELTTDFFVPEGVNASRLDGNYFTYTGFRNVTPKAGSFATLTNANLASGYQALRGLGVSYTLIQYPYRTINRPHTHPRGTELLYVIEGTLDVGLIDTTNKLFTQTLQKGDLFVFPKGLVHFQINWQRKQATALAAFSSSNPGTLSLPTNLFGSRIDSEILSIAFGVPVALIEQLKEAQ